MSSDPTCHISVTISVLLIFSTRRCLEELLDSHVKQEVYGEIYSLQQYRSQLMPLSNRRTVGFIIKSHRRIVCMKTMSKYVTARQETEDRQRRGRVWNGLIGILKKS